MSWLLPVTIVLLVSLALGAVHFYLTRALARLSEPSRIEQLDDPGNGEP